jgi:hypothetical protein
MPLYWWPPLTFAVYGMMVTPGDLDPTAPQLPHDRFGSERPTPASFVRRISVLQAAGMLGSGFLIYVIALQLGLSRPAATLALAATVLNPRLVFYVQALWPEWLHAIVFLAATALLVKFTRTGGLIPLAFASGLLGIAALIKGIAPTFLILLIPGLLWMHRGNSRSRLLAVVTSTVIPFALVTGPQSIRNHQEYGVFALSTNTWINIEAGLLPPTAASGGGDESVFDLYRESAPDPVTREKLSRMRVVDHLARTSPLEILERMARNYYFSVRHSFFRGGVHSGRWENAEGLSPLVPLVTMLSVLVFVAGTVGVVLAWRRDRANLVVALFLTYYLLALGIVGFNPRFFVQAMPLLGVMTALTLDHVASARGLPTRIRRLVLWRSPHGTTRDDHPR